MKNHKLKLLTIPLAVVLAMALVGTALAWHYQKDQTSTVIHLGGNDEITEVISEIPGDEWDINAIDETTLAFCPESAVIPDLVNPPFACDPIAAEVVSAVFSPQTLTVVFAPPTDKFWGDIFTDPLEDRGCVTGLLKDFVDGEPVDDPLGLRGIGNVPLCQPVEIIDDRRMTGGGSIFYPNGGHVRVTRGFELHCDVNQLPNNLQVNEHKNGKQTFHLTTLTSAVCTNEDNIFPDPPPGTPFDTFVGEGIGKLNRVDGAFICFVIRDDSEPGKTDMAAIKIWASFPGPGFCVPQNLNVPFVGPDSNLPELLTQLGNPGLYVNGVLHNGNFQAHGN